MVNAIISGNNETALFTNCKSYIIFLFCAARFLFLLFFSFSFPCLSSVSHSCSESLQPLLCSLSLPLPLLDDLPPSLTKPRPKHQGKPISIAMVFFLVCDLMVDSAVVVWVMDLAGVGIGVEGRSAWLCGFFFLFSSVLSPSSQRWIVVVVDRGSWLRFAPIDGCCWSNLVDCGWDSVWFLLWNLRWWLRFGSILGFMVLSSNQGGGFWLGLRSGWVGGGFCGGGDGGFVVDFLLWFVVVVLVRCGAWGVGHGSPILGFCVWWVLVATMVVLWLVVVVVVADCSCYNGGYGKWSGGGRVGWLLAIVLHGVVLLLF